MIRPALALARRGLARGVLCGPQSRLANGRRAINGRRTISELAGPALDPSIVKFLQVVPPLAFQVVILAPVQAIRRFREEGTTGSVSPVPYAAMCSNGAIWMSYGFLQGDPTIYLSNIPAAHGRTVRAAVRRAQGA